MSNNVKINMFLRLLNANTDKKMNEGEEKQAHRQILSSFAYNSNKEGLKENHQKSMKNTQHKSIHVVGTYG